MCPVSQSPFHFADPDFVRAISGKFPHGRFLIVGASSQELERQFAELKRDAVVVRSADDTTKLRPNQPAAHFETAVWFYPSGANDDTRVVEALAHCADN